MTTPEVLDPWVEKVVKEVLGLDSLKRDDDGTIPVGLHRAAVYISLGMGPADTPRVWISSPLLKDVEATPGLYERLNDLNRSTDYLRFYWRDGVVFADADFVAESFRPEDLHTVFLAFDWHAVHLGRLLGIPDAHPWRPVPGSADADGTVEQVAGTGSDSNDAGHVSGGTTYHPDDHEPSEEESNLRRGYL